MKFIDRQEELKRLNRLHQMANGGLAVLYGRRRIGKSHLLIKWCNEVGGLYTVGDTSAAAMQRQALAVAISSRFQGFDDVIYPTWGALLNALSIRANSENWHGPVVFDEFPYLVASDQTLPGVFQAWIDAEIRKDGILAVIAGSSQHMMQVLTLDSNSPLYGRAQEIMRISPIAAGHMADALKLEGCLEVIKAYSVWGGVPRYWKAAETYGNSLDEAIDDLILNPLGIFHDEPNYLLQMETPNAIGLRPYLDAIGYGAHRISEIGSRMQQPSTSLGRPMDRLVELGLVKREIPFGEDEKNSKKSLYAISDPFCHFWFRIVAPRRALFDNSTKKGRLMLWRKFADEIYSYQWEKLVRANIHNVNKLLSLLDIDDLWLPAGRWWQNNLPEWDIVATDFSGNAALLGEVKWSETPFTQKEIEQLAIELTSRKQPRGLPEQKSFVLVVPTIAEGVKTPNGVCLLTGDDIIEATLKN